MVITRDVLAQAGIPVEWVGQAQSPALRVLRISRVVGSFRPHLVYATHFYANLYAAIAARAAGCLSIGSARNDVIHEVQANGRWGQALLRLPQALIANSHLAVENAARLGVPADRVFLLPNVIDLAAFDRRAAEGRLDQPDDGTVRVVTVARLVQAKRLDRFIQAIATVRQIYPQVRGLVAGDGPARDELVALAESQGPAAGWTPPDGPL